MTEQRRERERMLVRALNHYWGRTLEVKVPPTMWEITQNHVLLYNPKMKLLAHYVFTEDGQMRLA